MAEYPSLPLWTDAYLADTAARISAEEHGVYSLLMQLAWREGNDARLPSEDDCILWVKGVCKGMHGRVAKRVVLAVLERFWKQDNDGFWYQKRLEKEWKRVQNTSKSRSKSAQKRWAESNDNNDIADANANARAHVTITRTITSKKERESLTPLSSDAEQMLQIWRDEIPGLPQPRKLDPKRSKELLLRLKDFCDGSVEEWRLICRRISNCPHLMGETGDWKANLDWCLKPRNLTKIVEGNYDPHEPCESKISDQKGVMADAARILQRASAKRDDRDHPAMDGNGQTEKPGAGPRGLAVAVLPDGREVPIHGGSEDSEPLDRGSPMVAVGGQGFRGCAKDGTNGRPAAAGEPQRPVEPDQRELTDAVGAALGEIVRGATSGPEPASPLGARKAGVEHGS